VFLDAIVDMKDEYIYMPKNIPELNRVSSCYGVAGLPGCCGSIISADICRYLQISAQISGHASRYLLTP
jgi:hypothetical protein